MSHARTAFLSSGACLSGVLFSVLFGSVNRFGELFGYGAAIGVFMGGGAIAVLLIPLVYYLLNRFRPSLWGRYHLPLVAAALLTSLLCVIAFGVDTSESTAPKIVAVAICLPLTEAGIATISYICYSVNVRLLGEDRCGFMRRAVMCGIGFLLCAGISALPLLGLNFASVGYGLGCLILVESGAFYFSSVSVLPRFRRKLPVVVTFKTIREGFMRKPRKKGLFLFLSALCIVSAVSLLIGFSDTFCSSFELASYVPLVTATAMAMAGTVFYALAFKKKFGHKATAVNGAIACAVTGALVPVTLFAPLPNYLLSIVIGGVFTVVAALAGMIFGSVSATEKSLELKTAGGIRFCMRIALLIFGLSAGLSLACVTSLVSVFVGRILYPSFAAVLVLVSGIFAVTAQTGGDKAQKEEKR